MASRYQSNSSDGSPNYSLSLPICITSRECLKEENNMRVLELNVSPEFPLMKQVVLTVNNAQSTMSFSSCNLSNAFELQI